MYLKVIACKALFREVAYFAAQSENVVDITCLEWGLHDKINGLNEMLKEEIAAIDEGKDPHTSYPPYGKPFDGILLAYGLCSNGIVGLSSEKYPLIVPRAHDCITLLLGSKERYQELFNQSEGTYWYSPGWIENSPMPGEARRTWMIDFYRNKYSEEEAIHMTKLYEGWQDSYSRLALIKWPEFQESAFAAAAEVEAQKSAAFVGWEYAEFEGDSKLMRDFINGNWDDERFLVVPPGKNIKPSYKESIITHN